MDELQDNVDEPQVEVISEIIYINDSDEKNDDVIVVEEEVSKVLPVNNQIAAVSVETTEIIVEEPTTSTENAAPSHRVQQKGLSFLLQQMKSVTSQSASEENTTKKRGGDQHAEAPVAKQAKTYTNPWKFHTKLSTTLKTFAALKRSKCRSNLNGKNNVFVYAPDNNFVRSVKWSPSGNYLLTDAADMRIRVLSYANGKVNEEDTKSLCLGGLIYDQQWHPSLDLFASTSNRHPIQIFDKNLEKKATAICVNDLDEIDSAYAIAFSNDGAQLFGAHRKIIYVFDLEMPAKPLYKIRTQEKGSVGQRSILSCMAMNPLYHGSFAVGSYNGTIGFYSNNSNKVEILFETIGRNVTHMCYSPDGNKLFYGCNKNQSIQCLDVRFGCKPLCTFKRPVDTSQRIYFEVDKAGKYLISGSTNNQLLAYDLMNQFEDKEMIEPSIMINDEIRVFSGLSLHPTEPLIATSHGERLFPFPDINDDDDQNEGIVSIEKITPNYGVKLWNCC